MQLTNMHDTIMLILNYIHAININWQFRYQLWTLSWLQMDIDPRRTNQSLVKVSCDRTVLGLKRYKHHQTVLEMISNGFKTSCRPYFSRTRCPNNFSSLVLKSAIPSCESRATASFDQTPFATDCDLHGWCKLYFNWKCRNEWNMMEHVCGSIATTGTKYRSIILHTVSACPSAICAQRRVLQTRTKKI